MKIQLIIIGNELLNGKISDRNTAFLAKRAFENNFQLTKTHIIGDDPQSFYKALNEAWEDSDLVLTSGGLGPTKDDLTKSMLADFFKKEIKENKDALKFAQKIYADKGKEYPEKVQYHHIPEGFELLHNRIGYAPSLKYESNNKTVCALPGVPSEFQVILDEEILPGLKKKETLFKHVIVKTYGFPEAQIFYKIAPKLWQELEAYGEVSSLPHAYGVDIGVKLIEEDQNIIDQKEKEIILKIKEHGLETYIWHIGNESLEEVIINEAKAKNITFGFAESCTGGLNASRITDIAGSSAVFWGSVVSYANEVKMNSLNVKEDTLKNHGAVSEETALEMATGAREHLGVDIAITTTGIAGPGGATPGKPVGTVGIGLSDKHESSSKMYYLNGNREQLKLRFSQVALFTLLERIRKY